MLKFQVYRRDKHEATTDGMTLNYRICSNEEMIQFYLRPTLRSLRESYQWITSLRKQWYSRKVLLICSPLVESQFFLYSKEILLPIPVWHHMPWTQTSLHGISFGCNKFMRTYIRLTTVDISCSYQCVIWAPTVRGYFSAALWGELWPTRCSWVRLKGISNSVTIVRYTS